VPCFGKSAAFVAVPNVSTVDSPATAISSFCEFITFRSLPLSFDVT
jgi:hypothetical protein